MGLGGIVFDVVTKMGPEHVHDAGHPRAVDECDDLVEFLAAKIGHRFIGNLIGQAEAARDTDRNAIGVCGDGRDRCNSRAGIR